MQVHVASPGVGVGHTTGSPSVLNRSSPTAASVDSFSSYINRDAPGFTHRSSSPRLEDQLRDRSDPASQPSRTGSPQPRLVVPSPTVSSREPFRPLWTQEQHLVRHHIPHVAMNHPIAIDVKRLSSSNLAEKDEQDRQHSLEHDPHPSQLSYHSASLANDDSFETNASTVGDDSKGEVRRRRRTRPDEANLLVEAYHDNAFPDHETRLSLANQVGMSVRAVSVWFQNRRQAEKKRSGRYSGGGLKENDSQSTEENLSQPSSQPVVEQVAQRKPLGNAAGNGMPPSTRSEAPITDFTVHNKENIPPGVVSRPMPFNPVQEHMAKLKRTSSCAKDAAAATPSVAMPRSTSRDLRALVGPEGAGLDVFAAATPAVAPKSSMTRHRSTPRVSLDQVLGARTDSMRRANTAREPLKSSDIEQDDLDTILPPRKILSRASSMSLLTTAGGRASLGNFAAPAKPTPASPATTEEKSRPSLNSRLPPVLTAALQKQGIIGADVEAPRTGETRQVLLEKMPDSSVSSSDFDMRLVHEDDRACDEDEERTLKMIAQRRAAKAHAAQMQSKKRDDAENTAPATEAREALTQARMSHPAAAAHNRGPAVIGLSKGPSLDWAAGRDRARTTAMPHSVAGTPFSRSVSASQLSQHDSMRAPELTASLNGKRSSAPLRSVSATDLTKRLQEARKKGLSISAGRKRPAKAMHAVNDENMPPHHVHEDSPKRRKHPLEAEGGVLSGSGDLWLMDAAQMRAPHTGSSPMLPSRPLMPHPSAGKPRASGMPMTPSSAALYTSVPMSSRSDRYRAIGASPAGSLGRSISANYHLGRGLPHSRESSAREQQGRAWDAVRPASHDFSGRAGLDDTWAAPTFSQPLPASTPSRVLATGRIASTPRSVSGGHASSPFHHDDSGFFGDSFSEDEDHELRKRGPESISPRKASLRSKHPLHAGAPREGDDHHAAQLLLGLGKSVGSREGSSQ